MLGVTNNFSYPLKDSIVVPVCLSFLFFGRRGKRRVSRFVMDSENNQDNEGIDVSPGKKKKQEREGEIEKILVE